MGNAYLSIDEQLYSLDDLDTVADKDYLNAYNKAYDFTVKLNKLPNVGAVDTSDGDEIDELEKIYNEMSEYEKSFVAEDTVKNLNKYIEKLKEVRMAAGEEETDSGEDGEKAEGTGDTESAGEV